MLPMIESFIKKYELEDFIVVADSGLMNNDNVTRLESEGYKYIIGARIKNENDHVKRWILSDPRLTSKWRNTKIWYQAIIDRLH